MLKLAKRGLWFLVIGLLSLLIACNGTTINGEAQSGKRFQMGETSSLKNSAGSSAKNVASFRRATVRIKPSQFYLNGDRLFLKLTRPNGESLFIGEIQRRIDSNISVLVPKIDTFINYQLFTSSAYDEVIVGKFII